MYTVKQENLYYRNLIINSNLKKKKPFWGRRILGGRNLVRVRNIVVVTIFDFMTVEDWGE